VANEAFKLRTRARIAAHVLWDHAIEPAPPPGEVPWSAEAASPEWLSWALCAGHPDARVEAVKTDGGSQGSSVRRRMTLTYNTAGQKAGLPEHLFAKATPGLLTRLTAGMVAPREGAFYQQIKAALPIETPGHYWSGANPRSGRSLHLFEDLSVTKAAQFCDATTAISRAQAEDMVTLLATMHGGFYNTARFAADLAWLQTYVDYAQGSARNGARNGHERAMSLAAAVIPADVMARRDEIWPMLEAGLELHRAAPATLLHSDVHLGNWYITGAGRMGLCDWALVCKGHWARDFAYAVSTSLAVTHRRAWERDLLALYLDRLRAHGGPLVTFEDGWRCYRLQLFGALTMWTPTLCPSPTRPEMQTEATSLEMIRRVTHAISDLNALDSQK
jgi:hypothetical protein